MPTYIVRPCLGIISIQENRAYSAADEWALLIGRDLSLGSCHGAAVSTPIAFAVVSVEPGVVAGANATKRRQAHRHVIKSYCRDNVGEDGVSACVDEGCDAKKEHWTQHISTILAVAVAERFSDQCARHSIRGLGQWLGGWAGLGLYCRADSDRTYMLLHKTSRDDMSCRAYTHAIGSLDMVLGGTYLDLRADKQAFGAVLLRERPGFLDVDFRTTAPGTSGSRIVPSWVIGLRTHRRLLAFTHAITFLEAADREAGVNWTCASQLLPLCKRTDGHSTYEEHHTVYSDHTPRGRRDGLQGPPLGRGCMARGSPRDPAACARLPVGKHGLALEASDSLISLGGGESLVEQLAVTIEERTPLAAARTITTTNTSASASMPSGAYTERASIVACLNPHRFMDELIDISVAPIHFDDASRLVSPPPWAAGRAPGFRSQINRTPGIWCGEAGNAGPEGRKGRLAITVAQQACALAGRGMGMCTSNKLRAHRGVSIVTAPQGGAGWTNYAASPMRSCASADAYRKRMSPSRRVYSERPHTLQPGCSAWMLPADLASSTSTARPEEPKARARAPLRAQGPLRLVPARQSARGRAGAECTPLNLANRSSTLLLPHAGVRVVRLTMRWARALEPADIEYEWGMICFAILRMHSAPHTLRDRIRAGTSSPCVILAEITAKHETLYGLCPPAKHAKKGGARKPQEREGTTQRAAAKATILSAQRHPFSILFTVQRVGGSAGMWTDVSGPPDSGNNR
ncbi:predicted protein [Postia placenta Mad-698-R]|nr:predicted protein [Postia placenta Mad-698-R]